MDIDKQLITFCCLGVDFMGGGRLVSYINLIIHSQSSHESQSILLFKMYGDVYFELIKELKQNKKLNNLI